MPRIDAGVSTATWLEFLDECPYATFFHTPEWYEAQAEALGYQPQPLLFHFEEGTRALLPLALHRRFQGLLQEAVSGVEGGYGGFISAHPLRREQEEEALALLAKRFGSLHLTGNPYGPQQEGRGKGRWKSDETQSLPIVEPAQQLRLLQSMRARHAKQAAKAGFRLEALTNLQAEDTWRFYPLYAAHAGEWTYTHWVHDERYFQALLRHAGSRLILFLAYRDDELAGFHLVGTYGRLAIQLHLGTARAFDKLNAGTYLLLESLAWCYAHGLESFDFLPSGRLEGVKAFKASFGAEARPFEHYSRAGTMAQALGSLYQLKSALLPRLPRTLDT